MKYLKLLAYLCSARFSPTLAMSLTLLTLSVTGTPAQQQPNLQEFANCRAISDDQARLNCLRNLLGRREEDGSFPSGTAAWPLLRTPHPNGGPDAISILRTADTSRSDPDLAGLMIRCSDGGAIEVLLALIRPIPPRSKHAVALEAGRTQSRLDSEAIGTGAALLLPEQATVLAKGPWQNEADLAVTVDGPVPIRGHISLNGLSRALRTLTANCVNR